MKIKSIVILSAFLLLSGCASFTGCKETSLANAEKYATRGEVVRVIIYQTYNYLPGYHSHAQAQYLKEGKWKYIETTLGVTYESSHESEWEKEFRTCFTLDEYKQALKDGYFKDWENNCKEEGNGKI